MWLEMRSGRMAPACLLCEVRASRNWLKSVISLETMNRVGNCDDNVSATGVYDLLKLRDEGDIMVVACTSVTTAPTIDFKGVVNAKRAHVVNSQYEMVGSRGHPGAV
jgi:hypothetical protein